MKKILLLLALLIIGGILVGAWWGNGQRAVNPSDTAKYPFVIQKGKGVREIASDLKKEGFIRDPIVFFLYVKATGKDTNIQAGNFQLSRSMNLLAIVETLLHGVTDMKIQFPEGKRAEEYAVILKKNFEQYSSSWNATLIASNGYLFPDTYLIPKDADVYTIISIMKNNFNEKISQAHLDTTGSDFSREVIIASLIEREARYAEDRPIVASVIYNRLDQGLPLQLDSTVQYALGYQDQSSSWWKQNLTVEDLAVDSPFNTYKVTGLPPAPICNPGLSSLEAAAHPLKTDFLYYVSDSMGHLHFAKTLSEHNQNVAKYVQ